MVERAAWHGVAYFHFYVRDGSGKEYQVYGPLSEKTVSVVVEKLLPRAGYLEGCIGDSAEEQFIALAQGAFSAEKDCVCCSDGGAKASVCSECVNTGKTLFGTRRDGVVE